MVLAIADSAVSADGKFKLQTRITDLQPTIIDNLEKHFRENKYSVEKNISTTFGTLELVVSKNGSWFGPLKMAERYLVGQISKINLPSIKQFSEQCREYVNKVKTPPRERTTLMRGAFIFPVLLGSNSKINRLTDLQDILRYQGLRGLSQTVFPIVIDTDNKEYYCNEASQYILGRGNYWKVRRLTKKHIVPYIK